ncbi:hypothetical protein [Sphingobacterium yanglingense]|uniref:hypothetical protein n=1 Tax=Sphingobacterium yanglingense TaxID=1437280 RepID=UPI00105C33C5|nr:hypothetical protein [Sphingobacterium yanglingense]
MIIYRKQSYYFIVQRVVNTLQIAFAYFIRHTDLVEVSIDFLGLTMSLDLSATVPYDSGRSEMTARR